MGRKSRKKREQRNFNKQYSNYLNKVIFDWFLAEEDINLLELTEEERNALLDQYKAEIEADGSIKSIKKVDNNEN